MYFIFENSGSLTSQYQRIQYESPSEWDRKYCLTKQPKHQMASKKVEFIWLFSFKTKTLGHIPPKHHSCCTFRGYFSVGDVTLGADY